MKKMVLTGIGSEQWFGDQEPSSESRYYLVFNGGELRVPTTEEAAQAIIEFLYGQDGAPIGEGPKTAPEEEETENEEGDDESESDEPTNYPTTFGHGRRGVTDEDGVDQV